MNSDKRRMNPEDEQPDRREMPGGSPCADSDEPCPNDSPSPDLARRTCVRLWDEIGRMEDDSAAIELTPLSFGQGTSVTPSFSKKKPRKEDIHLTPKFPAFKRSSTRTTPFILKKVSVYEETERVNRAGSGTRRERSTEDAVLPFAVSPVTVRASVRPNVISPISVQKQASGAALPAEAAQAVPVKERRSVSPRFPLSHKPAAALLDSFFSAPDSNAVPALPESAQAVMPKQVMPEIAVPPISAELPESAVPKVVAGQAAPGITVKPAAPIILKPVTPKAAVEPAVTRNIPVSAIPNAAAESADAAIAVASSRISLQDISREFARGRAYADKTRRRRFRSPLINGEIREELKDEYYWEILPSENDSAKKKPRASSKKKGQLDSLPERESYGIYRDISPKENWEPNLITALAVEPVIFIGHVTLLLCKPICCLIKKSEGTTPLDDEIKDEPDTAEQGGKKRWFHPRPIDIFIALICGVTIAAAAVFPLITKFYRDVYRAVEQSNVRRFSNSVTMPVENPSFLELLLHPAETMEGVNGFLRLTGNGDFPEDGSAPEPPGAAGTEEETPQIGSENEIFMDGLLNEFEGPESKSDRGSQE